MSRYIDADRLIKMISVHSTVVSSGNCEIDASYKMAHRHIIELIEDLCRIKDGDIVIVKEGAPENGNDQV